MLRIKHFKSSHRHCRRAYCNISGKIILCSIYSAFDGGKYTFCVIIHGNKNRIIVQTLLLHCASNTHNNIFFFY